MPTGDPSRQTSEEFDPDQTLFFSRRKKKINLLPLIVGCILVLGSGALIAWALTQGSRKPLDEPIPAATPDPFAGRPILPPNEAKSMENPPLATQPPPPPPTAAPTNAGPGVAAVPPATPAAPLAPAPAITPAVAGNQPPAIPTPVPDNPNMQVRAAMPVTTPDPNAPLNLDVNDADNAQVRNEVLRRIDLMPNISQANKDKLYASVDHARRMGRVLTIPFEKGESTIRAADAEKLKEQLQIPSIQQLLDDPTMVFVILGYADQKGNEKVNSEISLSRARSVMDTLRDKCGLQNVMHSVAMGGSTLFSAQDVEKNRVVEIWAVLP